MISFTSLGKFTISRIGGVVDRRGPAKTPWIKRRQIMMIAPQMPTVMQVPIVLAMTAPVESSETYVSMAAAHSLR